VKTAGESLLAKLTAVEKELVNPEFEEGDGLNKPEKLNSKLLALPSVVSSADTRPTAQSYAVFEHLSGLVDEQLEQFNDIVEGELSAFNGLMAELTVPAVGV
jgi:hypothetical protein